MESEPLISGGLQKAAAQVARVDLSADGSGRVGHFALDWPRVGAVEGGVVRVAGWARAGSAGMAAIALTCEGALLRELPLSVERPDVAAHFGGGPVQCGFEAYVLTAELPREFEVTVWAKLGMNERVPLARIGGTHGGGASGAGAGSLQPLLVTSLGRTGTTLLMRMLGEHPGVVVERAYPYETNAAKYWMHMARALALPSLGEALPLIDWGDWARPPLVAPPVTYSAALRGFVRDGYEKLTLGWAQGAIEAFYRRVAAAQGQGEAAYFCEKILPGALQNMFLNIYPGCREILLVRDFRDVMCSVLAFNAQRGTVEFGRQRVGSDAAYVEDLGAAAARLVEAWRCRAGGVGGAWLVRYEELVLRPRKTVAGILEYLGLAGAGELVEGMLRAGAGSELAGHRTSGSVRESIGRWQRDLEPELRRLCREKFDPMLEALGYELQADGSLACGEAEAGVA